MSTAHLIIWTRTQIPLAEMDVHKSFWNLNPTLSVKVLHRMQKQRLIHRLSAITILFLFRLTRYLKLFVRHFVFYEISLTKVTDVNAKRLVQLEKSLEF